MKSAWWVLQRSVETFEPPTFLRRAGVQVCVDKHKRVWASLLAAGVAGGGCDMWWRHHLPRAYVSALPGFSEEGCTRLLS